MKQRVMIAMALAARPKLLIADEPTTALDVTIQAQILELLRELQRETGMAVLLITHDLGVVNEIADRVAVMYAGRIVEEGTPRAVLARPRHPYTQGLLRSMPALAPPRRAARGDPGTVPSAGVAAGLPLRDALPARFEPCRRIDPERPASARAARPLPRGGAATSADVSGATAPLLRVEGLALVPDPRGVLRRTVAWVRAVDGVDLRVARGRTLALVGESGCGKTTVGRSILRLVEPQAGRVWFDGADLLALLGDALHPLPPQVQIVFQDPLASLDPRMRVRDAMAEGMQAFGIGGDEAERTERVAELLARVRLDPAPDVALPARVLRRAAPAHLHRARARGRARLIVCDEAVSALDVSIQAQILNLLRDLQQELGLAYLFITHDLAVVRYLADRVAVMYLGQIVEQGETERSSSDRAIPTRAGSWRRCLRSTRRGAACGRSVRGDVPSPARPPAGCRFHTRCPKVFDRCSREAPPLYASPTASAAASSPTRLPELRSPAARCALRLRRAVHQDVASNSAALIPPTVSAAAKPIASGWRPRLRSRARRVESPIPAIATARHQLEPADTAPVQACHVEASRSPLAPAAERSPSVRISASPTNPSTKSGTNWCSGGRLRTLRRAPEPRCPSAISGITASRNRLRTSFVTVAVSSAAGAAYCWA